MDGEGVKGQTNTESGLFVVVTAWWLQAESMSKLLYEQPSSQKESS